MANARYVLGTRLAACRHAVGLNQAQLAEETGFSRCTIANAETGRQHAPRAFLAKRRLGGQPGRQPCRGPRRAGDSSKSRTGASPPRSQETGTARLTCHQVHEPPAAQHARHHISSNSRQHPILPG
jgi:DNA-binding XRE family transcriptional regulator